MEKKISKKYAKKGKCFTLFHMHKFTQSLEKKVKILEEYIMCEEENDK
jgi:hypothetical protein